MCSRKTYNRFKKIHDYILKNSQSDIGFVGNYEFNTNMGDRIVYCAIFNNTIALLYLDNDKSELFSLHVKQGEKIWIVNSKIDEPAIFAAIYELECIIDDNKVKYRDSILERLFKSVDEYSIFDKIWGS